MYLEILKKFIILLNFITLDSILYSNYSLYTMDSPLFTANAHVIRIILIDLVRKESVLNLVSFENPFFSCTFILDIDLYVLVPQIFRILRDQNPL